jgi:hypothetical protein
MPLLAPVMTIDRDADDMALDFQAKLGA